MRAPGPKYISKFNASLINLLILGLYICVYIYVYYVIYLCLLTFPVCFLYLFFFFFLPYLSLTFQNRPTLFPGWMSQEATKPGFKLILVFLCSFSALTLLVGRQEGHLACKNGVVGCWHGARYRFAYGPAEKCIVAKRLIGSRCCLGW